MTTFESHHDTIDDALLDALYAQDQNRTDDPITPEPPRTTKPRRRTTPPEPGHRRPPTTTPRTESTPRQSRRRTPPQPDPTPEALRAALPKDTTFIHAPDLQLPDLTDLPRAVTELTRPKTPASLPGTRLVRWPIQGPGITLLGLVTTLTWCTMHALIHYPKTERTLLAGVIVLLISLLLYTTRRSLNRRYPAGDYAGLSILLAALAQFTSALCGLLAGTSIGFAVGLLVAHLR